MDNASMLSVERVAEHVVLVTLSRPARRNAVDLAAVTELGEHLDAALDGGARVVVVTGAGGHFCAGADLAGVDGEVFVGALTAMLARLRDPGFVTMAAVEGACLGVGMQLAVSCDLRVALPTARFGVPAAKLGLAVDHETIRRLATFAGEGTARAMLLATEEFGGEALFRTGLVQRLGGLDDALAWAGDIAALAPLTQRAHKLGLELAAGTVADPAYEDARRRAWGSADLQEGLAAFRERRPARFEGR